MKNTAETRRIPWDWFDASFAAADASPIRETSETTLLNPDEIQQAYAQGAELILHDINVLKSLIGELRVACDDDSEDDEQTDAEEGIEAILECLVRAEEAIRESEQIVNDVTFQGWEWSDSFGELPLPRGNEES